MAKSFFSLIILIHGLIHLLGFFKAFDIGHVTQLTVQISRPAGYIWLIVAALFLITALAYMFNYSFWPFLAMIAVAVSQVLIFTAWGDAKFGTIANLIVLLAALPAIGHVMFDNRIQNEQTELLEQATHPTDSIITGENLEHLPPIVQTWLTNSGVAGKPDVSFVRLKQTGEMRTELDGKWMNFNAV